MEKTTVVSIRIDAKDVESLRKQALEDGMSLNSKIIQILRFHLEWEHIAPKVGLISVQKQVVKDFIDYTPEDELRKIAIRNADAFSDDLRMFTGKDDLESFLLITRLRVRTSGFFLSQVSGEGGNLTLTCHHGMGRKWSFFFAAYNQKIIENLGYPVRTDAKERIWITRILAEGRISQDPILDEV